MTTDVAAALEQCEFFATLPPKHIDKVARLGSEVHFEKEEIIFREDDESDLFFVILSGRVALEARPGGREFRIQTLLPGDEMGWSAMLHRKRQFQARALEPVRALAFEAQRLREALDTNPYFARAFLERLLNVVAERLQGTRLQLVTALAESRSPSVKAG